MVERKGDYYVFPKSKNCRSGCGDEKKKHVIGGITHTPP